MTDNKQPEASELVQLLQGYANDPMWAEHAEVPKSLLRAAIKRINTLQMHAGDHLSLGNEIEVLRQQLFEKEQEWIASDLKRIAQIAALSSQQPAPKDEPQRQGSESEISRIAHILTGIVACNCCYKTGGRGRDDGKHCDCRETAAEIIASRPATVVDDAAVSRALHGFDTGTGDPNDYRKRMRAALLAAFP